MTRNVIILNLIWATSGVIQNHKSDFSSLAHLCVKFLSFLMSEFLKRTMKNTSFTVNTPQTCFGQLVWIHCSKNYQLWFGQN